ncbi:MAG: type III glutamate--ammonia ligase [Betaproteobacteria bacterium]|jgi:glutamine synthetase|nr:type III glutamate--ammonia ligase [Rhodocyclaceae bacterium]MCA3134833.1 type III glutamate--ammonia ligase [Rhodocyclaceae bacterium]MCA3142315.1 type III glutamate--ammonia ligase [Rhodocyclaceae bacterium]MCA3146396.1 type III glutamate--ammonia ligase [Rhodocyclaceae bacterium]MCE2898340.1 type III glutamate--ammonia ligase [Betaproteobacteria bacterium]
MTPAQAKKLFKDHGIKYILAQFVDIHGAAKAKAVPVEHLEMVLTDGAGFAGFALWGFGMGPQGPDYMAVGDLDTLQPIPWMPGFARMATWGHVKGKPYPYDSRLALKNALDGLKKKGLTLYTGIEPEFMLLKRRPDGAVVPCDDTDTLEKPCYDYKGLARSAAFLEKMTDACRAVGIDVYQIDHEDANGQFEVNYTYGEALINADRHVFLKMAASEIARGMDLIATFMPKPFSNRTGTGAHFHLSMGDGKTKNLFHDPKDKRGLGLSKTGYHFLGGLLHHARALTAICAPTVNSYKRLVVGRALSGATWAPAYIAYGDNNRTCMVRVPYGRLEMRLPDGATNPYLATAAILAAGMDGVDKQMDPGEPNNTNLYEWTPEQLKKAKIGLLPQNLNEAIDALEADKVVRAGLGEALADEFIRLKRMEWVEYSRHVSAWEVDRYLEFF